ncbi:uncharacterized protein EDB91DRAFT_1340528 [Suillus paluster]|uniref:uncharacterized protein n=1 Tax=Suillus paluster TaxID=48578 RepID=UPI001B86F2C7|nr:uncharacterized protein EDB91DRAFT_1340528 [Suillus paluster]KAG1721471.1 hypothetical protein EDB91DRAFT_1340528 [Suillus paluster]
MAQMKIKTGDQPWLNDRETTTLQSHVEDWEKMDKELLKQQKEKYRQWFHNHKKHKADAKPPMKLQKKWMAHRVIKEEWKADILQQIQEEIEEETGEKPEQKEVLRRYQPKMTAIMKGLDDNKLEETQAKADESTNQAPDAAVQAKMAKKKGKNMIKHFAKEMFTQAGMRLFVLGSWKDEQGSLLTSGQVHSFIHLVQLQRTAQQGLQLHEMQGLTMLEVPPSNLCHVHQDQDQDQDGMLLGGIHQGPKPYYKFDLDYMGLPILPDIDGFSLNTKKGVIRSFLTIHYMSPFPDITLSRVTL